MTLLTFGLAAPPDWRTCTCGELTNLVPCWMCVNRKRASEAEASRVDTRARTIPPAYDWATEDSPDLVARVKTTEPLPALIRQVVSARNVVFSGPAGAGKTSLAVACLRHKLEFGGRFVSAPRVGIAAIQHKAGQGDAPLVEAACDAPMILLDDVGSEVQTATNAVPQVLYRRHEDDLQTWITTGLSFDELQKRYGDGIARRIAEHSLIVRLGRQDEKLTPRRSQL